MMVEVAMPEAADFASGGGRHVHLVAEGTTHLRVVTAFTRAVTIAFEGPGGCGGGSALPLLASPALAGKAHDHLLAKAVKLAMRPRRQR